MSLSFGGYVAIRCSAASPNILVQRSMSPIGLNDGSTTHKIHLQHFFSFQIHGQPSATSQNPLLEVTLAHVTNSAPSRSTKNRFCWSIQKEDRIWRGVKYTSCCSQPRALRDEFQRWRCEALCKSTYLLSSFFALRRQYPVYTSSARSRSSQYQAPWE